MKSVISDLNVQVLIEKCIVVFVDVFVHRMTMSTDKMAFHELRREHSFLFKVPQHDSTVWL